MNEDTDVQHRRKADNDRLEFAIGPVKVGTSGKNIVMFASFAVLFGFLGYLVWNHDRDVKQVSTSILHVQTAILKEIQTLKTEMVAERRVTNYILTLSPEERAKLKLDEPDELRNRRR